MRIQHNIAALNSYRNLTGNNNAVAKNLEKLSSGYRINRAGDDAAGLAISEKMRAQITGLETAQKNANDGISLVQTAEGALTEVHSMLNRMVELADQSANGTYDNETDRANLQKEVQSLKDEIDRISEGTNFNGINLLDGSLGSTSGAAVAVDVKYANLATTPTALSLNPATQTTSTFEIDSTTLTANSKYSLEVTFSDPSGKGLQTKNIEFTAAGATAGDNDAVIKKALEDTFGSGYTVTADGADGFSIEANTAGSSDKHELFRVDIKDNTGTSVTGAIATAASTTKGGDAYYTLTNAVGSFTGGDASGNIFEINGQKFAYTDAGSAKDLDPDVNYIEVATAGTVAAADAAKMATLISNKTGIAATQNGTTNTSIDLKAGTTAGTSGTGLTLQIGDTAESFNQLTVSVGNMSSASLGISGIDISTQSGAKSAVELIKNAINSVSSTRGDLGAIQNRLEHTINNLSVTTENMTAAESRIRDVDMADEMMSYTKNNILVQASQAMLAQANQVPQGVLQLLQ